MSVVVNVNEGVLPDDFNFLDESRGEVTWGE
jgi:hypothetical protein